MTRLPTAAALVLFLFTVMACATTRPPVAASLAPGGVEFVLEDRAATSVAVAGSFNAWSISSHPMVRRGQSARWSAVVRLAPGDHQFMFVVDGTRWVVPSTAAGYVDDGFGSTNAVVTVPLER
jgi:1,4-alpha-glucan branching enzyme